eukprot:1139521-Pelagomonas_calceolata.AAC.3
MMRRKFSNSITLKKAISDMFMCFALQFNVVQGFSASTVMYALQCFEKGNHRCSLTSYQGSQSPSGPRLIPYMARPLIRSWTPPYTPPRPTFITQRLATMRRAIGNKKAPHCHVLEPGASNIILEG